MALNINREAPYSGISSLLAMKGRMGDTELVHMTKPEVSKLKAQGLLSVNPNTGLPEHFLGDLFKGLKSFGKNIFKPRNLLPIAGSLFAPAALGTAIPWFNNSLLGTSLARGLGTAVGAKAGGRDWKESATAGGITGALNFGLGSLAGGPSKAEISSLAESYPAGGGGIGDAVGLDGTIDPYDFGGYDMYGHVPQASGAGSVDIWEGLGPDVSGGSYDIWGDIPSETTGLEGYIDRARSVMTTPPVKASIPTKYFDNASSGTGIFNSIKDTLTPSYGTFNPGQYGHLTGTGFMNTGLTGGSALAGAMTTMEGLDVADMPALEKKALEEYEERMAQERQRRKYVRNPYTYTRSRRQSGLSQADALARALGKDTGKSRNFYGPSVYAAGGGDFEGLLEGEGHGMEDNIHMPIKEGGGVAAVSPKEYVVPADMMASLGNGNPDAGATAMDKFIADFRKKKYGRAKQPPQTDAAAELSKLSKGKV